MTETEWITDTDSTLLLEVVWDRATDRKLFLFAVACCRRVWHLFRDERSRRSVAAVEQFADGCITADELAKAGEGADEYFSSTCGYGVSTGDYLARAAVFVAGGRQALVEEFYRRNFRVLVVMGAGYWICSPWDDPAGNQTVEIKEHEAQVSLMRDIFGNPFRPVAVDPAWRTGNVTAIAQSIYDERAFDRMPILADALEDAGCNSGDMLNHCRMPGEHVRGCWVVDLILCKE